MWSFKGLIKYFTTPTSTAIPRCPVPLAVRPLTEGKTRGNVKPLAKNRRPRSGPPAPKPKSREIKKGRGAK